MIFSERKETLLRARVILVIAVVSLLWASSLSMALALTSFLIQQPQYRAVYHACDSAYEETKIEKHGATACIERQVRQCNTDLERSLKDARARAETAISSNAVKLALFEQLQHECSVALDKAQTALKEWQVVSDNNTIPYVCASGDWNCTVACGDEDTYCDCTTVASETYTLQAQALQSSDAFATHSISTVHKLASFAEARAQYDLVYIDNKTQALRGAITEAIRSELTDYVGVLENLTFQSLFHDVDLLVSCISTRADVNATRSCHLENDARALYDDSLALAQQNLERLKAWGMKYQIEANDFTDRVSAAFDTMVEFYNGVIGWIYSLHVELPNEDWFGSEISDFYAPSGIWPSDNFISTMEQLPSADQLYPDALDTVYTTFVNNLTVVIRKASDEAKALTDRLLTLVPSVIHLDDYNPPQWQDDGGLLNSSEKYRTEAAVFINEQSVAYVGIDASSHTSELDSEEDDVIKVSVSSIYNATLRSTLGLLLSDWEPLTPNQYTADYLLDLIKFLIATLLTADYIWRAYQSAQIMYKYFSRSAVGLPRPDVRVQGQVIQCGKPQQVAFRVVFSPVVSGTLLTLLVVIVAKNIGSAYAPLFQAYVDVCVDGGGSRDNGTFIAKNLYSLGYNYATADARSIYIASYEEYELARLEGCTNIIVSMQEQYYAQEAELRGVKKAHLATEGDVRAMSACIRVEELDSRFVYENLSNQACFANTTEWHLDSVSLDCQDDTPACTMTCEGPDTRRLRLAWQRCACMGEFWIHAGILQLGLAAVVFVLMNASRLVMVYALNKLVWCFTESPRAFDFLGSCDADGSLLYEEERKKAEEFCYQAGLHAELRRRLYRWEGLAWLQVVFALLLNVAWILLLLYVSRDIVYDPSTID